MNLKVACWNIRTLLDSNNDRPERRTALLAMELSRYDIDLVALSETRLPDEGQITEVNAGYTFFWKGKPKEDHRESGVGFAMKSSLVDKLEELPLGTSDRLMSLRLPLQNGRYITVFSVYAPTMSHSEDEVLTFYSDLRKELSSVHKDDKILLLGDFNARVGSDYDIWNCLGKNGIGNQNGNGLHLLQLCTEYDLIIGNTIFRQKNKYKGTWMHPRSKHWHMIDYIITRKRDLQDLNSVKVMRGAECWTDHRLVSSKLKLKIRSKFQRKAVSPKNINVSNLNNEDCRNSMISHINNIESLDPERKWDDFKNKIYNIAKDTLGLKKRKHQDWFDDNDMEIQQLLREKQKLHDKTLLQSLSVAEKDKALSDLKMLKSNIQRHLRNIQNRWWEDKAQELQNAYHVKDSKSLHNLLKQVYGPQQSAYAPLKSKDKTEILREPKKIQDRWREHYSELLNRSSETDEYVLNDILQFPTKDFLDNPPIWEEVSKAISQMNCGKSPGMDGIPAEILKFGGNKIQELLYEVILNVWDTDVPQDWRDAVLVSLYKKGDKSVCDNYRGISLLSIAGKVFARVLLNRLIPAIANDILPESQCGFRAQRGTCDMMFSARQLQEKCIEQNQDLYQCFVDLTKAFDTVSRPMLWKVLKKFGCPDKFTQNIQSLHNNMKARVNINGSLSEAFSVESGVKQGDILAPTLFALYFTAVFIVAFKDIEIGVYIRYRTTGRLFNIRRFTTKTKVMTALIRDLLYADDCDLVAHTEHDLQKLMDCFDAACKAFGLEMNLTKTEIMLQMAPGKQYEEPNIHVRGTKLKVVKSFVYLGSALSDDGGMFKEINNRIQKATVSFKNLEKRLWSQHGIKLKTKISIYTTCVLSVLLYGSETWMIYKTQLRLLERFHQRCLRHILHVKWTTHTPDTEILEKANILSVEAIIIKNMLRWCGHLVRMDDNRIPKQLLYSELQRGKRKASKPKQRYKDLLKSHMKKCELSLDDWEEIAMDRQRWRHIVFDSVKLFEDNRIKHEGYKRSIRKGEQSVAPEGDEESLKCDVCGRVCLSLAGYKSHIRSHNVQGRQGINKQANISGSQGEGFKCMLCGRIAKSKAGLKSHLRSHEQRGTTEVNPRSRTRGRVDN